MDTERAARAVAALEDGRATPTPGAEPGTYTVPSFTTGAIYTVDLTDRTCTCPDSAFRGATCKHLLAVALLRGLNT